MVKPLILLKLGGSSITDKKTPYKFRLEIAKRLANEIKKSGNSNLIIAHGSGSFGHTSASKYGGKKGYKSKIGIATVARDANKINQLVMDVFVSENLAAISVSPRSLIISKDGKMKKNQFEIIEEIISQGLIPVVYGDIILDLNWKTTIYSGEKNLSEIANHLIKKGYKIQKVIEVGETEGVLDENGKTINIIDSKNWKKIRENIFSTNKLDVTGGMAHKVEEALSLSKKGVKTMLISDSRNNLFNAITNKPVKATVIQ